MPEEGTSGILIEPNGHPAEVLSHEESAALAACLRIFREDTTSALYDALQAIIHIAETLGSYPDPKEVLKAQISDFLYNRENEGEYNHRGVLAGKFGDHRMAFLDESERELLDFTLTAIRRVDWFKAWLDLQVHAIATNHFPEDCHPSPLQIAGSLTLAITEWEDQLEAAKRFAKVRPDLVLPAIGKLGGNGFAEPPAAPEPIPEPAATSTKPKPQGTRKRGRKAA